MQATGGVQLNEILASMKRNLVQMLTISKYRKIVLVVAIAYVVVYLLAIQDIVFVADRDLGRFNTIPSIQILENWRELIFRPRVTFYWEAIGQVFVTNNIVVQLSIPNILLGSLMGTLMGLNVAVAAYSLSCARACRVRPYGGIIAALPSFFTGFACCTPTFVVAILGGNVALSIGILSVRNLFIPIAISAMVLALLWSAQKMGALVDLASSGPRKSLA